MQPKRVVITGMGAISGIGNNVDETWQRLVAGKSGVGPITLIDTEQHTTKIASEVKNYDPADYFDRKEARKMDRFTQFAMIAADEAVQSSGIDLAKTDTDMVGVISATGIGGMQTYEDQVKTFLERGARRVSPFFIPMLISDIASGHISIKYGLKGINYCTTSACASASHALGDAFNAIRYGQAIAMLAGGSEAPVTHMGLAGFNALKALSTRNDEPEKASRPFDADRDGFIMAEGGAMLFLEELEHAKARGATLFAEIVGVGFTGDAYHITAPAEDGDGARRAMLIAVKDANIEPTEVDYLNAHGTSTPHNDRIETKAVKLAFGEHARSLKINSTKSMSGHLLGASGAIEAIATILEIKHQKLHPTINYTTLDPNCDLDYVPNTAIDYKLNIALSNSFGFGGHNVTLAFKRFEQ